MSHRARLEELGLHGLAEQYDTIAEAEWLPWLWTRRSETASAGG